ncbi:acetyl-coenzyme A synthetase isoform X2 [Eurytemora carolleeae]|uniref:acetyl-coenzyme A synthetase isoform X2 n=1 Tax=Eurytemora carolleeae TaxID=1294199 RepID=UPI000C75E613|nr:acetyl-coenzyme A synthetase isoform X2 [Eurytemora carolleeae]|eukprot:XP_023330086.1 acetyl-coenzyme A synthetase-like isoform X2 [Eurytemora affinis]
MTTFLYGYVSELTMSDVYSPPDRVVVESHCKGMDEYKKMYDESIKQPHKFWGNIAEQFFWKTPVPDDLSEFMKYNFNVSESPIKIEWMCGAQTNICYNALDRNVEAGLGDKIAFYWVGNDPADKGQITYRELLAEVCKFSNVLVNLGVKKGDRVAIYMPMVTELVVAMLACARIGAVHSIVFGGYSADSLATRILDAGARVLVTADGVYRGTKLIKLLQIATAAMEKAAEQGQEVSHHICVSHLPRLVNPGTEEAMQEHTASIESGWKTGRDNWWHELMRDALPDHTPEWVDSEDPLFMLYTSGSTGKPKGVLHSTAGYMLYTATTFKHSFDHQPETDVYWCTADIGWITGHSYVTYGPLLNSATSVLFEGTPFYPDHRRCWEIISEYKVSKFYTAPTAIRSLMKFGSDQTKPYDLSSLKVLGTVGEPINPEAWQWYHSVVGQGQCSITDTYWQTETGGHIITPLPGATHTKPGSACFPFFGVVPEILDEEGKVIEGEGEGYIVFKQPWPGMMRTVYGDHERFEKTYFSKFPGYYMSGDGAKRDKDGYIWITGRIDDILFKTEYLDNRTD